MKIASISPRKIWIIIICAIIAFSGHLSAQQDLKISSASSEIVSGSGSFDLGDVMPGSLGGYYFIVENVGDADLTFSLTSAVTFGGTNPGDFSTEGNLDDMTLAPGELDVFDVTFTPGTLGARSTVVTVSSDDPDESSYTFTVTVNSIASPASCILMTGDFENSYISSLPHLFEPGGITEFEAPSGWGSLTGTFLALFGADLNIGITADSRSGSGALELISNLDGLGDVVAIVPCTVGNQATLRGYYKYTGDPSENAVILISTSASNQSEQNTTSMIISSEALTYTFFEMDFPYYGDSEDQLLVQLFTTNNGGNATFILDDLEIITTPVVAAPPGQPAPVTFTSPAPTSVTVNWTEPFDFGSTITGYTLEMKPEGGVYSEISPGPGLSTSIEVTGLTTGTNYLFRVKATNAEGDSPFSDEANFLPTNTIFMTDGSIIACDAPFTDSGGAAGNYMDNENFELTISPENLGDKVKVTFSSFALENFFDDLKVYDGPNTSSPLLQTLTGNSIPSDITSTATGGELTFVMESDGSGNDAGWEAMISCVTPGALPPEKPDAVTFSGLNTTSVNVHWTAPSDNGSAITGYTLEQKEGVGGVYSEVYTGTNLTFNATGLTTGETYYFKVKATNIHGDSDYSDENGYTAAEYVGFLEGSATTCNAVFIDQGGPFENYYNNQDLTFTLIPDNPGGKINVSFTSFDLEASFDYLHVYDGPTISDPFIITLSGNALPSDITASGPGGELTFRFTSDISEVRSGWEAIVTCSGALTPDKPEAPTFGTITTSSIEINWTAPNDNGESITSYILEEKVGSGGTFSEIFNGNALTHTSSLLNHNQEYFYRVQAVNTNGGSLFSDEVSATTLEIIPELAYSGSGFTETVANDGSVSGSIVVTLTDDTFTNAGGTLTTPTHFTISNLPSGLVASMDVSGNGLTATLTLTGQAAAHENANDISDLQFTFTDAAFTLFNAADVTNATGPASSNLGIDFNNAPAAPDAPAAPTFGTVTENSIVVNWAAPNDNGSAISEYILQQKEGSGGTYATVSSGNTNLTYTATSLTASTQYFYKVQAVNGIGSSPFSSEANTTTSAPAAAPDAPAAPTFGTITSSSIVVNWTAPNDNGSVITEYILQQKEGSGGTYATVSSGNTNLTYSATGLTASTQYFFKVQAVNAIGSSAFSSEANTTTSSPASAPDAPAAPTFGTVTASSIVVNWTAPNENGSAITGYVLQQKEGSGGTYSTVSSGNTSLSYTATGLNGSTQYFYKVQAVNAVGSSPFSIEANTTTSLAATAPNAPAAPTFGDVTTSSISITWVAPNDNGSTITGYILQQKEGTGGTFETIFETSGFSFIATGLNSSTEYFYKVQAVNAIGSSPFSPEASQTTSKLDQTITITSIPGKVFGDPDFEVFASSDSGLPVTLTTNGPITLNGTTVSISGVGPASIVANQAGNDDYNPAPEATMGFFISPASQEITFTQEDVIYSNGLVIPLNGAATSGLPVTYSFTGDGNSVIDGDQFEIASPGIYNVTAYQGGDDNYLAAPNVIVSFCVNPPKPVISVNGLGTGNVSLQTDQGFFQHRWYQDDVEMFEGVLQSNLIFIEEAGVYSVESEISGCTSERSDDLSLIITDVQEAEVETISVYPNPVENTLNIRIEQNHSQKVVVALHDLNGKYLLTPTSKSINGYLSMDVSEVKSGFYILRLQTEKGISQIKFSKK